MTRSVVGIFVVAVGLVAMWIVYVDARTTYLRRNADAKCKAQMALIGESLERYASDHGGRYPQNIEELVRGGYLLQAWSLVCPLTKDRPAWGNTTAELANKVSEPGHLSYVYIGAGVVSTDEGDTPVLFEPPENHGGKTMLVLFKYGRAEELRSAVAWTKINEVRAKLSTVKSNTMQVPK